LPEGDAIDEQALKDIVNKVFADKKSTTCIAYLLVGGVGVLGIIYLAYRHGKTPTIVFDALLNYFKQSILSIA